MKAHQSLPILDEAAVAEYIQNNSDFFDRYPKLLENLHLPHQSGKAVSLVEKQIGILRARNTELRQQLNTLLSTAATNNILFQKICGIALAIIDSNSLSEIDHVLDEKLSQNLLAEHVVCYIRTVDSEANYCAFKHLAFVADLPQISLMHTKNIICGPIRENEFSSLFPSAVPHAGSVVLIPLNMGPSSQLPKAGKQALLAIGSEDNKRFSSDLGTVFLKFLGDVLARALILHTTSAAVLETEM